VTQLFDPVMAGPAQIDIFPGLARAFYYCPSKKVALSSSIFTRLRNTMRNLAWVILSLLLLTSAHAACRMSDSDLTAYQACLEENSCLCGNCDPDPTDGTPNLSIEKPESCQDVNRIFCPFINCCSACVDVAEQVHKCAFDTIAKEFVSSTCDVICNSFPYGDEESCSAGEEDPEDDKDEENPNDGDDEDPNGDENTGTEEDSCETQKSSYTDCVEVESCEECDLSDLSQTDLPICCVACSTELNALVGCNALAKDDRGEITTSVMDESSAIKTFNWIVLAMGIVGALVEVGH